MGPLIIGVAGGTGSGKTTVANRILERVGAEHIAYIPHDAYYINLGHLPAEERAKTNFDHPNSLETPLLVKHIKQLRAGKAVDIPVYDFTTHTRTAETLHIDPAPIVLVEGIFGNPGISYGQMHTDISTGQYRYPLIWVGGIGVV